MEKSEMGKSGDGFIDRNKVRILLCDNDEKSSEEVLTLLCKCSYQVTPVRSPRQVIDALNAEGPDIDIILSEVDLPMSKGLKMLKYIMRDKELRRIPVIMMSAQDEVSIVVKCLKFGAADYLVKPLRTNELLNLWTHMWRRRQMLRLAEKNIVNYEVDVVVSDHSDANTNSTTLISDDTDEKSRKTTVPDPCTTKHQEDENNATTAAASHCIDIEDPSHCQPDDISARSDGRTGPISLFPKKSELKLGESSAFFMYVKSSPLRSNTPVPSSIHEPTPESLKVVENLKASTQVGPTISREFTTDPSENNSTPYNYLRGNNFLDSFPPERNLKEHESRNNIPDFYPYPYYMPGLMSQVQMQSNMQNNVNSTMLPQYNHFPQCPPAMAHYPYYPPFGICLQPGQMPVNTWQLFVGHAPNKRKLTKVDRRETALMKFRQKRKGRCFDKKIRYANRKKLAERRPRVRGQFVRKVNGVNVDLNGQPASEEEEDEEDEEEYDEDDQPGNMDFSPDDDSSICPR